MRIVAARYMAEFRCLGSECEDTCCASWTVFVDEAHHAALQQAMSTTPEGAARFERALRPDPKRRSRSLLVLGDDGKCTLLDGHQCSVQRDLGEKLLPDACAMYPRTIGVVGDHQTELTGSLSCPEVARRCLLDERALDLVPVDAAVLGRGVVSSELKTSASDPYTAPFNTLRGAAMGLLSLRMYPVAARLYFLTYLADRTRGFLRRDMKLDDELLLGTIGDLRQRPILDALAAQLEPPTLESDGFAIGAVVEILRAKLHAQTVPALARVAAEVLGQLAVEGTTATTLSIEWRSRRAALPAAWSARIALYFENYARNFWLKEWYLRSPTFLGHLMAHLIRVAALRFLFIGRAARSRIAALPTVEEQLQKLDALAVDTFYSFARGVEQDDRVVADIVESLRWHNQDDLGHLVALLQL